MRDTNRQMMLSYDKLADVLYISLEILPPGTYEFVENQEGDVLKVELTSKRVVGVTVVGFIARAKRGQAINIPEIGPLPFSDLSSQFLHA